MQRVNEALLRRVVDAVACGDGDHREVFGAGEIDLQHSEHLGVFGGALGPEEVWARRQMTCPSTGAVVFDSGEVRRENGFRGQKRYSFRFASKCPR